MKILWCTVFYLVVNDFQTSASKFQYEKGDMNPLTILMQRIDDLEKLFKDKFEIQEQKLESLEKLLEEEIERIDEFVEFPKEQNNSSERVDCNERCEHDDACTSVFWSNSSDSECKFNHDNSTLVKFIPGELYYCKDCQTTLDLVFDAEYSGVIKLVNVATNKTTQASSYANAMSNHSMAVDGDPNTWFSSHAALLTKEEPWLMVDLGQRFLVAQIKINVRKRPIYKTSGGYFQVCLVDDFDSEVNPCNKHSEILKVNRRLRGYANIYEVNKVIMGRYVMIKKIIADRLEIVEIEVLSVIPTRSYQCHSCFAKANTVCDESRITPVCSCAENHLPVGGDARNGCEDPCLDFNEANAVCNRVNDDTRSCSCNAGYHPVRGEACNGCTDPCIGFKDRNTICLGSSFDHYSCECKEGHFEIFKDDPCSGCLDPCSGFKGLHSSCMAVGANMFECSCEEGFSPIYSSYH